MTVSATISAESAGCRGISSAAYRGTAARSYRCHLESSPGAAVAGLICRGFFLFVCADNGNVLVPANYEKKEAAVISSIFLFFYLSPFFLLSAGTEVNKMLDKI